GKLRCFFHDSFEYTGDFTTHFMEEFQKRRGYDLTQYLNVLAGDCNDEERVARVKSDYRETLSDLVLESFIQPMTVWANSHKSLNRNQAHGSPGNILDLYAACDIPETEIFGRIQQGSAKVFIQKFASSAAHVTGQKLISSESFTWLDEHWTVTPAEMVRATNRFFLAGINHMFFHGNCYSPKDEKWPGWLFYASTQLNNRNPLWPELPTLFKYIERTQTILQQSTPQNDLLVYWPYYDVAASKGRLFNHIGVSPDTTWLTNQPISNLLKKLVGAGYSFDYISDKQLLNCKFLNDEIVTSGEARYKAVIVPKTKYIPVKTMKQLQKFIAEGGKVFFDETLPCSVPGMFNDSEREKQLQKIKSKIPEKWVGNSIENLAAAKISGEKSLSENGFHFIKMKRNNENWYLVFNTNLNRKDEWIELGSPAKSYVFLNLMDGKISLSESKNNKVRIQLNSEQAVFIKCTNKKVQIEPHQYFEPDFMKIELNGRWKVEFIKGGPVYPGNFELTKLKSWTAVGDPENQRFAGTARYTLEFDWNGKSSGFLDLGDVKDCAHVYLNKKDFGTLQGPCFSVFVDNLKQGINRLQIEVTNVAANRIRDLDRRGVEWRKFYDINFVTIDYEPFDASGWKIRDAGLLGPVQLFSN
ncbi:MAG: hypothetical protein J7L95_04490, partial [Prolixibacteraceae bacterium]|nr:hypothetical protein [Prolixibacteraceae bacterium]